MPQGKEIWKGKQKTAELETISEADLTEAEQLKIITKNAVRNSRFNASGLVQMKELVFTPGVTDALIMTQRMISLGNQLYDDDHDDDEKVQDDDEQDVDKTVQEDDDEEQTESDDDGDDFVHPKLTTHDDEIIHEEDSDEDDSSISSSDDEDSDDEDEGTNVEGAKSNEEATYEEDQGTEAVKDTNTDLDGRDKPSWAHPVLPKINRPPNTAFLFVIQTQQPPRSSGVAVKLTSERYSRRVYLLQISFSLIQLMRNEEKAFKRTSRKGSLKNYSLKLELKMDLNWKDGTNNSFNRSAFRDSSTRDLVEAYEVDKIL
ncbi:hypothetical protein Tco_0179330 [Tanacetum coccineum]